MLNLTMAVLALLGPNYDLTDNTLTVTQAEVVAVRGPDASLVEGVPLIDDGLAWGERLVWELAPGVYAVTAFGPEINGVRDEAVWEITVNAPPPPTRAQRIRAATLAFFQAAAELRALNPTDQEVFAAFRGE